tara:strand:- start:98 stop:1297 length:1200 start_codon:yes stop_codon:yes gene_type:complete
MIKKIEDYEWFCPQPFVNVYRGITGHTAPCCTIKNWYVPTKKFKENTSVHEDHSSALFESLRQEFLNGGSGPLIDSCCTMCIKNEFAGKDSHRIKYMDRFIGGDLQDRKEELELYLETDRSEPLIMSMEYKVQDNYCNLKCNMCRSANSSTLAAENIELEKSGYTLPPTHELPVTFKNKSHYKRKESFDDIDHILKTLSNLQLVGGETLAIPKNYELLNHIIGLGVSSNITLQIITNGTIIPKIEGMTILDYIPYFKRVDFNVSIEFWGEKNDYLRYGSNWSDIITNVSKFKEHGAYYCWTPTISALNIGYLNELPEDVALNGMVYDVEIYSIKSVPPEIKELYLKKNNPDKIVNLLKNTVWDENKMKSMLLDISLRDKLRGTCLTDVFPEWKPYYEKL